jgi:acyl-CoA thioester hydrolase
VALRVTTRTFVSVQATQLATTPVGLDDDHHGVAPVDVGVCRVRTVPALPNYDLLVSMPATAVQPVPVAFEDNNGQLNVRHYLGIGSEGLDESLAGVGIPHNWPLKSGLACLSAEHHLTYQHELRVGDVMSVRVRLLGRSKKAVHAMVFVLDDTHQRVSCVFEEILLCVRLEPRRSEAWPDDVAAALDARIAEDASLDWEPVTTGCLSLR